MALTWPALKKGVILNNLWQVNNHLSSDRVHIIGGGLAGTEAAWQAASLQVPVTLYEMKPRTFSPAHTSPFLAELVCSNSFRSLALDSAVGLLKEELRRMGSLIMLSADQTKVPAGKSLAVDREAFSQVVTEKLEAHPLIEVVRQEITNPDLSRVSIIASGPLSSQNMIRVMAELTEPEDLYFYDAISPIVYADTIDFSKAFYASRYEQNEGDYINCSMNEAEYRAFYEALVHAEQVPLREFEEQKFFEGCLPIEVMAARGIQTLLFGPMKPVGLTDPRTQKRPFAVVQLRRDNSGGTLYNMVGFQTKLKYKEQERIFRMIPGLEKANFARLGSIHRNTFINGPRWLTPYLSLKNKDNVFFAGQITGVEGYVESTAMGLLAGINAARSVLGRPGVVPPAETALGALVTHVTRAQDNFQPMNVNFGLFPPLDEKIPRKTRRAALVQRALAVLEAWRAGFLSTGVSG
jgi:methylenetetrahydrofolate--tRNA-(uracil-5-)-methyltransferase